MSIRSVVGPEAHPGPAVVGEEYVPQGEADAIAQLKELAIKQMMLRATDGKPKERGQHPKHHGFVVAKFTVLQHLPDALKVGLFREPRTYTAVIRFSSTTEKDDRKPDNHGMAIKVLGVKGEKLLEDEGDPEIQDFVLLDHPLFFTQDAPSLLEFGKVSEVLVMQRWPEVEFKKRLKQARPREYELLEGRKQILSSPLATGYFSTTPYKLGETAVKYMTKPEQSGDAGGGWMEGEDSLRRALVEQLTIRKQPATIGFHVQRQGDPAAMPIEDPTVEWTSDPEKVATIQIDAQEFDFPEREAWGNALSFNPWRGLKDHRPLGGINRARKVVYPASAELRHQNLHVAPKEPTEADIPMGK